ncbi:hypothetical protein [Curtobacterium sp. MCLR17_044]|jgi:hypothetical protein|uniref:hypothetical protein n=1 Tax=Curtobacterium sp. MCLR17_044 TaxID=2175628 RepID=UPI000DAAA37D|nr:hypothetical protein [Curtobacterium sp. MCLR17_044]PZE53728.1 hypothetical protein DEJ04_17435 [Curtobacterium sp. MCLR17_044]
MSTIAATRPATEVEPIVEFEPVTLKRGKPVELVRWWHSEDGWSHDLVRGRYRRRNREGITLEIDGELREFPRNQWHVCAP